MDKFVIRGGKKLKGEVSVSGAKNVALKVVVAACLTDEKVIIENIPRISDFEVMAEIVRDLGGEVRIKDHRAHIRMKEFKKEKIALDVAAEVRTSAMFVAPLLARINKATIPNPGGCRIGARPIDRIIAGLKKMGANATYNSKDGFFHIKADNGLKGTNYAFSKNTHTGTETLIMAAVLSKGKTVLDNAAEEPEVDELIAILNQMGAKVKRIKKRTIEINGVRKLHGAKVTIAADRNEIVTFAIAALMTEGDITVKNVNKAGLFHFLEKFKKANGGYEEKGKDLRFYFKGKLAATDVATRFYPGFMTDWQGPWAVLMTKANGTSIIHETVYENRFNYVSQLHKMGAKIELFNPQVKNPKEVYNFNLNDNKSEYSHAIQITGPIKIHNAVVEISDLRAGATLVLAALSAPLQSVVFGVEHLDRGYENFEKRLRSLGANIKRIKE
ncbi:MAG: UDP-N-acetylglucosamine 1-carboxyvinyltransferase [Candidatus Levybacteria bacterium]|nr:UDP-N-acetylglucosamine 1-carboxyvinyltransferase [Candidatus Levybacteria bacterium]